MLQVNILRVIHLWHSQKSKRFWFPGHLSYVFLTCERLRRQENPPSQNTIHNSLQNCFMNCFIAKQTTPYVKTYCWYYIVEHYNMQMGKNSGATCSKLIKWVKSYQVSHLLLDLRYMTRTKLFFFQNKPIKSYDLFKQRKIWKKYVYGKKLHQITRPTFSVTFISEHKLKLNLFFGSLLSWYLL